MSENNSGLCLIIKFKFSMLDIDKSSNNLLYKMYLMQMFYTILEHMYYRTYEDRLGIQDI